MNNTSTDGYGSHTLPAIIIDGVPIETKAAWEKIIRTTLQQRESSTNNALKSIERIKNL